MKHFQLLCKALLNTEERNPSPWHSAWQDFWLGRMPCEEQREGCLAGVGRKKIHLRTHFPFHSGLRKKAENGQVCFKFPYILFLGCSSVLHFKKVTTSSHSWPYWMEWIWIRRHGPHLSLFPQDGVTPVLLLLLAAYSCSVLCLNTPALDHHLPQVSAQTPPFRRGKPPSTPSPHLILPAKIAAFAWHTHGTCDRSLFGFPEQTGGPRGRECVLLLAVSPAPRPGPKATQSLESTSYQLQYQRWWADRRFCTWLPKPMSLLLKENKMVEC